MLNDIIIFSTADWDAPSWTNKQHMAVQFAENGYRVLYVDSLGLRHPGLNRRDVYRICRRLKKALPYSREVRKNIWRVSPLVLPFQKNILVEKCNTLVLQMTIRWHMHLLEMKEPIILTYNPTLAPLCASLPHSLLVYHCVDDLRASPHVDIQAIIAGEEALAAEADICFTTSPLLQSRMKHLFVRCEYEPNVCDPTFFAAAKLGTLPEPEDIASIAKPRALFIGALSDYKVDFELVIAVAERLPQVQFVFIGAEGEGQPDSRRLPRRENIHVLGARPYKQLPTYMAHVDMAILPAAHNEYTASMFPMKFFEYLASGLQVVSTELQSLREFSDLCFLSDDIEGFVVAIEDVLSGTKCDTQKIEEACTYYSWNERFKRMHKQMMLLKNQRRPAKQ